MSPPRSAPAGVQVHSISELRRDGTWSVLDLREHRLQLHSDRFEFSIRGGRVHSFHASAPIVHGRQRDSPFLFVIADGTALAFEFTSEADEARFAAHLDRLRGWEPSRPSDTLFVISLVRTKQIAGVKRNARTKAMAIVSRVPYIQVFKVISPVVVVYSCAVNCIPLL